MRTIHVFSVIPKLADTLKQFLPKVTVVNVDYIGDIDAKYSKQVQKEEIEQLQDSELLLIDNNLLAQCADSLPKVKWAQGTWAGVEGLAAYFREHPHPSFSFTRMSNDRFSQLMAEYVVGMILNHEREWFKSIQYQQNREWAHKDKQATYRSISDLTVGIAGIGVIGKEVARILKSFRATVYGLGRSNTPSEAAMQHIDKYWKTNELGEMIKDCDCIVNILPCSQATDNIFGNQMLNNAKKCPLFINIGRGNVISEHHILEALDSEWISGAVLDVFQKEPLPESSSLWSHPKIRITPHTAGVSRATDVASSFVQNFERFENNQPLLNKVDWERGY